MPGEETSAQNSEAGNTGSPHPSEQIDELAGQSPGESEGETQTPSDTEEDILSDWPADALPVEDQPPAQWTTGDKLAYAIPRVQLLPGQRRPSKVSPVVGTIAMWMAVGSAAAVCSAMVLGIVLDRSASAPANWGVRITGFLGLLGSAGFWGAIILGTMGRLNAAGRRQASLGRRIGCAIPLCYVGIAAVASMSTGRADACLQIGLVLFVLIAGNLIILIVDGIIGAN